LLSKKSIELVPYLKNDRLTVSRLTCIEGCR